jgi:hypothetical protein
VYVAVYDDRASQGIHVSARRPAFIAIGDQGPQPLWVLIATRDAYTLLAIGADGEVVLTIGLDAATLRVVYGDAVLPITVLESAETTLVIPEQPLAVEEVALDAISRFDGQDFAGLSLIINDEAQTQCTLSDDARVILIIPEQAEAVLEVQVEAETVVDIAELRRTM